MKIEWMTFDAPKPVKEVPAVRGRIVRIRHFSSPGKMVEETLLVGDVNELYGQCDDCSLKAKGEKAEVLAYSDSLVPLLPPVSFGVQSGE